jgi:hypothetical protein
MTAINSDEDFAMAVSWLVDTEQLPVQGARFIDNVARKVFDERGAGNVVEITPTTQTLETALDNALLKLAEDNNVEDVRQVLAAKAKSYFAKQYLKQNADTLATIFAEVSTVVNTKPIYIQIQARRYELMRLANGWPQVQDTSTNIGKARYLETIQNIIAIYG